MHAIFTIATKNLFRNKLRTSMTVCGTAVGLSLFVVLMTIAQNLKSQTHHMIDSFGVDIVIQADGAPNPISSRISLTDVNGLLGIEGVKSVSGLVVGSKRFSWNHYLVLLGADPSDPVMDRFPLLHGRIFSDNHKEIIIGSLLARKRKVQVNDTIHLDRHGDFLITGIFSTGSRAFDGSAFMGLTQAQALLQRGNNVNLIVTRLVEKSSVKQVMRSITEHFPHLEVRQGLDFVSQIRMFKTINGFAEAVAAISLIACCITVMDTLLMAISERTREFGILMAIGWSRWHIVWIILIESILICLAGSVLGNLLGTLFLWITNNSQLLGIGWVPVWPSMTITGTSIILGIAMGCLSAIFPSVVVSRMLPVTALRFEK